MLPRYTLLLALVLSLTINSHAQEFLGKRESRTLDSWKFYQGDTSSADSGEMIDQSFWQDVHIPHTWNSKDISEKGPQYYQGIGWYRTQFHVAKKKNHERMFLRFEGVSLVADIFVNGNYVAQHKGGYSAFTVEITDFVNNDEDNIIAVKVDNSTHYDIAPSGSYLYPIFGGIYRPVTLFSTSETCISPLNYGSSGIYITQKEVNNKEAKISIKTLIHQKQAPMMQFSGEELQTADGKPGLTGNYYDNDTRGGTPVIVKNESSVIKNMGEGSPDPKIAVDSFSMRWEGQFVPKKSGTYTFYIRSDDGSWFYINDDLLIDNGGNHATFEKSAEMNLVAGTRYPIKIDYTEKGGGAYMRFGWTYQPASDVIQNYIIQTKIIDKEGKTIEVRESPVNLSKNGYTDIEQQLKIENPHLWNAKHDPYMYTVQVNLINDSVNIVDTIEQPLGLRSYYVDTDRGLILNGRYYNLYGVCRHQEWKDYGPALNEGQHLIDFGLIQEIGANGIRLAHYQQADLMYTLSDKAGMVVWAEIPNTPVYRTTPEYLESCAEQLRELILQNYNHPSIFFWGLYNEVPIPTKDVEYLNKIAKDLDPQRLTTQADFVEVEKRHTVTDLAAWNWYFGWYYGKPVDYNTWFDSLHSSFPQIKGGLSEYGAGGCIAQQEENPKQPDPGGNYFPEQYQRKYHELAWQNLQYRNDIWCKFVWNMFDFSWSTTTRGDTPYMNHKGLVTHDRKTKKDAFYFYKANWSDEPVIYIASRRNTDRRVNTVRVEVYTNTEFVELYVNGTLVSEKGNRSDINKVVWENVKLKQGRNNISVIGRSGNSHYTDSCIWTYTPEN